MFRNLFIAIFATAYLLFSSGVVVNVHYCMNAIASVTFGYEGDHSDVSCSKCGMDKGEYACCSDKVQELKINDVHQPASIAVLLHHAAAAIPEFPADLLLPLQGLSPEPATHYLTPPPRVGNKLYRSLNVFRI